MDGSIRVDQFAEHASGQDAAPVYLAVGGEPLLLDEVVRIAREELVDPATRDFNLDVFYGDDIDSQRLAASLSSMPMMADRRVVLIRRAQSLPPSLQTYVTDYIERPVAGSLLLLAFEGEGKAKWVQKLAPKVVVIPCETPRRGELRRWVKGRAEALGIHLADEAMDLVTEGRGLRLIEIAGELEKAALLAGEGGEVGVEVLQQVWGLEPEINIWRFFDHVASGRRLVALREFDRLRESFDKDQTAGFILSQIARVWRTAEKEREYDNRRVPPAKRLWSGNTRRQWQFASPHLKSLPLGVARRSLERLLDLDRNRKTRTTEASVLFARLIHRTALDRGGES